MPSTWHSSVTNVTVSKPVRSQFHWFVTSSCCSTPGLPPDIIAVYLTQFHQPSAAGFNRFELNLRVNLHDTVHCRVGGDMCTNSSANAPEFFLHHAFIDKIWANWQEYSERHRTVHFSRLNISMIGTNYRPRDFMDTIELPDIERPRTGRRTCVLYQDPTRPEYSEIMDRLAGIFTDMSIYDYMTT